MSTKLKHILAYLEHGVVIESLNFKNNGNGNQFGILNGVYPLYKDGVPLWHYTTDNNSTGQSLERGKLVLRDIDYVYDFVFMDKLNKYEMVNLAREIGLVDNNLINLSMDCICNSVVEKMKKYKIDIYHLIPKGIATKHKD